MGFWPSTGAPLSGFREAPTGGRRPGASGLDVGGSPPDVAGSRMSSPPLSIVIRTLNSAATLGQVLGALLGEVPSWSMPGVNWSDRVAFYEDFPYAWWNEFDPSAGLPAEYRAELPAEISLSPEIADISAVIETKIQGIKLYESQVPHLFGSDQKMADAVRGHGARVALSAGASGAAERYWSAVRRS